MIALISPAKSLDYRTPLPDGTTPTRARFHEEADTLAAAAAKLGPKKLGGLMRISDKLAKLNAERFRDFAEVEARPALYAFAGDVYQGLEARTLDAPAVAFAQDHLRMLSGLYGLLRPLDAIRPHRLEMGTGWAPGRHKDLYGWWGMRVADRLAGDLAATDTGTIINLASREYWQVIAQNPPASARIVTIDFRENGPNGLRFSSFAAKRARGLMARYLCEHRLADAEALKSFDSDGYRYEAEGSTDASWRFVRGAG